MTTPINADSAKAAIVANLSKMSLEEAGKQLEEETGGRMPVGGEYPLLNISLSLIPQEDGEMGLKSNVATSKDARDYLSDHPQAKAQVYDEVRILMEETIGHPQLNEPKS